MNPKWEQKTSTKRDVNNKNPSRVPECKDFTLKRKMKL